MIDNIFNFDIEQYSTAIFIGGKLKTLAPHWYTNISTAKRTNTTFINSNKGYIAYLKEGLKANKYEDTYPAVGGVRTAEWHRSVEQKSLDEALLTEYKLVKHDNTNIYLVEDGSMLANIADVRDMIFAKEDSWKLQ